jgi:hypothetical protein
MGTVATPFERRPIGTELALCQRYYQRYTSPSAGAVQLYGYQAAGNNFLMPMLFPPMRASPGPTVIGAWTLNNCSGPSMATSGSLNSVYLTVVATGLGGISAVSPANGGFDLSAEL